MRTSIILTLTLFLAACGGSKPGPSTPEPDTTGETPATGDMMTPDECEAAGGHVVGDIGDGSVACPDGEVHAGDVSGGVEQQLCCAPEPSDME
jgi:hypothetical protein